MSAFLTLDQLSLAKPDGTPLFENLTLSAGAERIGLVGRNGCGKSTLIAAIAGDVQPARGAIHTHGRFARLEQRFDETLTVAEALGVADALACLARITAGDGTEDDFETADWTLEARLGKALAETGLDAMALDRHLATLSGGERTRVGLARLLLAEPDLILLDEPTNNLDADGRAAVMTLMQRWSGGLIVASHDRALLECVDRIVELTPVGCTVFGGGWRNFAEARDAARARAAQEAETAANKLKSTERKVQQAARPRRAPQPIDELGDVREHFVLVARLRPDLRVTARMHDAVAIEVEVVDDDRVRLAVEAVGDSAFGAVARGRWQLTGLGLHERLEHQRVLGRQPFEEGRHAHYYCEGKSEQGAGAEKGI